MEKEDERFWVHTPLHKMTTAQWESLCDEYTNHYMVA